MNLSLVQIKYPNLSFYNSAEEFSDIEMQIDINHQVHKDLPEKDRCKTITKLSIFPKNSTAVDGQFAIRVETEAIFIASDFSDNELHNETFKIVYSYIRSSVAGMLAAAQFPPFYLPYIPELKID